MPFSRSDENFVAALQWIARTPQGQVFFEAMQEVVEEIGPVETCALHAHNERRKFASNLIAMAEADRIDERRTDDTRTDDTKPGRTRSPGANRSRRHGPSGRK